MANTLAPFGFRQTGVYGGVAPNFGMITRTIDKDDNTKVFFGDPVKSLSTGYVAQWTAGTAVSQLAGIFVGCKYLSTAQGRIVWSQYWPGADAAADVEAYLAPCNLSVPPTFVVQSSGTAITLADIGANADVSIGTGSTVTGVSGATLDQASIGVEATKPFRIVDLYRGVGNGADAASSYNWVLVAANVAGAGSTGI